MIENEIHLTICWGFKSGFDFERLATVLESVGPLKIRLGKVSRFSNVKYDVLKLDVDSKDAVALNDLLMEEFKDDIKPSEHPFTPHVTLAYVTPGTNLNLDGSIEFDGVEVEVDSAIYSADDYKKEIPFKEPEVLTNKTA